MLVGIDIVEIERFEEVLRRRPNIVSKIFTTSEIAYCNKSKSPAKHFAVRFAAKEAFIKAFGRGMYKMPFKEIEVRNTEGGIPSIDFVTRESARIKFADTVNISSINLSMSHSKSAAVAVVVVELKDK